MRPTITPERWKAYFAACEQARLTDQPKPKAPEPRIEPLPKYWTTSRVYIAVAGIACASLGGTTGWVIAILCGLAMLD